MKIFINVKALEPTGLMENPETWTKSIFKRVPCTDTVLLVLLDRHIRNYRFLDVPLCT